MRLFDSSALDLLNRALGLAGGAGSQNTQLEDGLVSLTVPTNRLIGRARSPVADRGASGFLVLENNHAAATTEVTALDVYNPTNAASNFWPVPVPTGFDVWIFGVSGRAVLNGGNFADGYFGAVENQDDWLFSQDENGGSASANALRQCFKLWDAPLTAGGQDFLVGEDGESYRQLRYRVPRGSTIEFRTTAAGAGTYACYLSIGIWPVGIEPDA